MPARVGLSQDAEKMKRVRQVLSEAYKEIEAIMAE